MSSYLSLSTTDQVRHHGVGKVHQAIRQRATSTDQTSDVLRGIASLINKRVAALPGVAEDKETTAMTFRGGGPETVNKGA